MTTGDIRSAFRHRGKLRVSTKRGTGFTSNFSLEGVYFYTPERFVVGETIEFYLNVDHESRTNNAAVRFKGKVLRVEPRAQLFGMAVKLETNCCRECESVIEADGMQRSD